MGLPLQVGEADKRAEDLMKKHTEGDPPVVNDAPPEGQDAQPTAAELQKQLADAQTKLSVLQGKYNKEIKNADLTNLQRLENENVTLKRQMRQMQEAMTANSQLVKDIEAKLVTKETPTADAPTDISQILTEEDRATLRSEDIGDDVLPIIMKLARAAGGGNLANQVKEIKTAVDNTAKRVETVEKTQADSNLLSVIPDFFKINDAWGGWLDNTFRRDSIQLAFNRGDFQSVKNATDLFKQEAGWQPPADETAPPKKAEPKQPTKKTPPVEPNESLAGDSVPIKDKPTYTSAQVKKHHEDMTKGHWVGREKQAQAISDDMLLAAHEGRITA